MRRPSPAKPPAASRRKPPPPPPRRRLLWRLLAAFPSLVLLALGGWVALFAIYAPTMPDTDALMAAGQEPTVTVLAADGSLLAERTEGGKHFVPLERIAPDLINAVVATEDQRFWQHFGLDPLGIMRAGVANLRAGGIVEGGSTITQQLAKILFLTPERSFRRKLEEMTLAIWLEARLTKSEILALYLNRVYLGAGTYGVDAAARRYFAKPAAELTLAESAMIAGLLKAPSALAPTNDLSAARDRAAIVLSRMVEEGYITRDEADAARTRPAKLAPDAGTDFAGYFVDWVMDGLEAALGEPERDLVVRTTLDRKLQRVAEASLASLLAEEGAKKAVSDGAVVLLDRGGAVRALVGGTNWRANRLNRAVALRRQPGSVFKPFLYLAAFEEGLGPGSTITDAPVRIGKWEPANYDGKFHGTVTLEEAFALSLNTPAARLVQSVGPAAVAEVAYRLGIASELEAVPSIALGTSPVTLLEVTRAYLPFSTGGMQRPVHGVTLVTKQQGGEVYRFRPTETAVIDRSDAEAIARLMRTAVESGTGHAARIAGRTVAGKTGTTQSSRDAWFIGFSGDYVLGVWLGNDDNQPMRGVTGGTLPARLWREVMAATPAPSPEAVVAERPSPRPPARASAEPLADGLNWLIRLVEDAWTAARQ